MEDLKHQIKVLKGENRTLQAELEYEKRDKAHQLQKAEEQHKKKYKSLKYMVD